MEDKKKEKNTMNYRDLREWLTRVEDMGELQLLDNVDWDKELGAISLMSGEREKGPALLFDHIRDYPAGYRVLANAVHSPDRVALCLGFPLGLSQKEYSNLWRKRYASFARIPPVFVEDGPVMENVQTGDQINALKFPSPIWYEKDGGRYIGTYSFTLTRDPDTGWINLGTYRVMVHDEKHLSFHIEEGRHGYMHREKYFARNEPCPVAISLGHDPLFFLLGSVPLPTEVSEYEYAGGLKGRPIEVIRGPITGLPIPAHSEIVIEGEALPGHVKREGPFGEWTGYYGCSMDEPVIDIKAIYHRNDPIILGAAPVRAPGRAQHLHGYMRRALLLDEMAHAGVPDVVDVGSHPVAGGSLLTVVSIKQRFPGHSRQAGMIATFSRAVGGDGRYVIVVDDDINVMDLGQVMWAVCTRSDPVRDIDIVKHCWSTSLDPIIPAAEKGFNSRAVIDACRPWEWRDEFPEVVGLSPERRRQIREKWGKLLDF